MSMDKINGSPLLRQGILDGTHQNDRVKPHDAEKAKDAKATAAAATGVTPASGDTVEISATAHRLMDLRQALETGYAALEALPETRTDKVSEARKRLQSGAHDPAMVRDKVAAGIEKVFEGIETL